MITQEFQGEMMNLRLILRLFSGVAAHIVASIDNRESSSYVKAPKPRRPLAGKYRPILCLLTICSFTFLCGAEGLAQIPPGITYVTTANNWSQALTTPLSAGTQAKLTLASCPVGMDTVLGTMYRVYISDNINKSNSEAVAVTGGTCTASTGSSGTIILTPYFSHSSYTIGSASSGIQETINAACGMSGSSWLNSQCYVRIPPNGPATSASHTLNNYNVYSTIFLHGSQSTLNGRGVSLNCMGRGPCLQIGDQVSSNDYVQNTIEGISFRSPTNVSSDASYAGVQITNTVVSDSVATISTASAHGFRPGDLVTIRWTDNPAYWGDAVITSTPTKTTFQYAHPKGGGRIASQTSAGVVALAYEAVLDNSSGTHFIDIAYDKYYNYGQFNQFFDFWDDENATVEHFDNHGIPVYYGPNWFGDFVYSGGASNTPSASQQFASVITFRDSAITGNYANGITDYNSNGLYVEDSVIESTGLWQVYASNTTGNYQCATIKNLYSENAGLQANANSPFAGTGLGGIIFGGTSGSCHIQGQMGGSGEFQTGGTTGALHSYTYYIVVNDTTAGTQTSPMEVLVWQSTGSDSIQVRWPRVANGADTIKYDVIRVAAGSVPADGSCTGGSGGKCGYVVKGLTQSAACGISLLCTYSDRGNSTTYAYAIRPGNYIGALNFWAGALVSMSTTVNVDREQYPVVALGLNGNPLQSAKECTRYGVAAPGAYTSCLTSITTQDVQNQSATILTDGNTVGAGSGTDFVKGRVIVDQAPSSLIWGHDIFTLVDTQPALTQSSAQYRPQASASDTGIGLDNPSATGSANAQLAFRAPVSISDYINAVPKGANWLERLTSTNKQIAVPLTLCVPSGSTSCPTGTGTAVSIRTGNGSPNFACTSPTLYLRANPPSASEFLYVCISGNSWTAITFH
jgi:hypothetical protein